MSLTEKGSPEHVKWMRVALELADKAAALDEVPVGAVVVSEGLAVGRGFNRPITTQDPSAHAEIVALREAGATLGNYRLPGTTLYVTVEPCTMCAGALVHARVETLVFGVREPKAGAVLSQDRLQDTLNHRFEVIEGVLEAECRERLQTFFARRR
jgi:tRNA(adenine34) deaminase